MHIDRYNEIDSYLVNEQIKEINSPDSNVKKKVAFINYWYVKRLDIALQIDDIKIRDDRERHIRDRMEEWRRYVIAANVYPKTSGYDLLFKFY
jgi:hypothetical protein